MDELIELWEKPAADEKYMIAGWRQWADAGAISSNLPPYLIEQTGAKQIGLIKPQGFYLFQIPGAHHFLRPQVNLEDGYRRELQTRKNEIFYSESERKGLFIFLGDEPHLNAERYAQAFFDMVEALEIKRVVVVGGVYGAVPYDKERQISCVFSLPRLKAELAEYAVRFANYEGGVSIGTYLADQAEQRGLEYIVWYGFVPAYDFSQLSANLQGMVVENDFKAWYDLMRRLNHMFGLGLDLTDLARRSDELLTAMGKKLDTLERRHSQLNIREHLAELTSDFTEMPFIPLDDVWERELGDLFEDLDNE
ncbi:MAG: PAC2 family protein [Anaerolineales bacterium]|nr:PAC2 family protein [Anaerolineales bacterium]